jgi:hypothetical protein
MSPAIRTNLRYWLPRLAVIFVIGLVLIGW